MEWNTKPSLLWDLENLFEFDAKAAENPKKLLLTDCSIEVDQFVGSGSFYSVEDGGGSRGTGGSGSELGHTSSKSSKSASMYSSSIEESKTTKFTLESSEGLHWVNSGKKDSHKVKPLGSSPTLEISAGSGEPLLSLKLGKRMYFEDISAGHNMKPSALSALPVSSATTGKKCKPASQSSTLNPLCQVEGCNIDLSSAKDYHRKHRICESHSKSPRVVVAGAELRFCQQCSRFHGLAEFDDEKRSCRKRLSDHNARRRKPQPEAVRLNPTRLSSLYGERQPMNFIFDQAPTPFTRQNANLNWDVTESSYFGHTREYMSKPTKAGGSPGQLCFPNSKMSRTGTVLYHDFNRTSPSKGTSSEVLNPGLEDHGISSNLNANQDLNRALSLLSTSSWVSCETKPVSVDVRSVTQQANVAQPALNAMTQGLPLASGYWQAQQLPVDNSMHIPHSRSDGGSHFQDLNFFRTPYDSGLFSSQFN